MAMAASPVAAKMAMAASPDVAAKTQRCKEAKGQGRRKGRPQGRCPLPNAALYSLKVRSMQDGQRITVGSAVSAGAWSRKSVTYEPGWWLGYLTISGLGWAGGWWLVAGTPRIITKRITKHSQKSRNLVFRSGRN